MYNLLIDEYFNFDMEYKLDRNDYVNLTANGFFVSQLYNRCMCRFLIYQTWKLLKSNKKLLNEDTFLKESVIQFYTNIVCFPIQLCKNSNYTYLEVLKNASNIKI